MGSNIREIQLRVIQANLLHNDLTAAGIPIVGCAPTVFEPNKEVQHKASYIPYNDRYARIDWKSEPSQEQKAKAAEIVARHAKVETIDLNAIVDAGSGFPREQQEKVILIKTAPSSNRFSTQEILDILRSNRFSTQEILDILLWP